MDNKSEIISAHFDRLAKANISKKGRWDHNNNYYKLMIKSIPPELPRSVPALDIGCGTGELCRLLAQRFDKAQGIDLSKGQLEIARSFNSPGCQYSLGDFMNLQLEKNSYSCIVSAAAAHHMPYGKFLRKCRDALISGGVLIVLDLYKPQSISDYALRGIAFLPNRIISWCRNRHNPLTETEKSLWREHCKHDVYMSIKQIRDLADINLGGYFSLRRLLFFRYILTYIKAGS